MWLPGLSATFRWEANPGPSPLCGEIAGKGALPESGHNYQSRNGSTRPHGTVCPLHTEQLINFYYWLYWSAEKLEKKGLDGGLNCTAVIHSGSKPSVLNALAGTAAVV